MINVISLFSGCGGLDLGFEQVGDYRTVWANDFNHDACETYRRHFGIVILEGDIEQVDPYTDADIPACDLILGGFPCQDFSIIWKQLILQKVQHLFRKMHFLIQPSIFQNRIEV